MPRLLGVEIPAKKKVAYSLRYINGIGPTRADLLVKEAGLNPDMRAQDLTEEQLNKILHIITEHKWVLEGDLRREIAGNLKRLRRSTAIAAFAIVAACRSAASAPVPTP